MTSKPMAKDCYSCDLYYRKRDENFAVCPHISNNTQDGFLCPYVEKFNALQRLREVFHKWFSYEDETLLDLCLAVAIHSIHLKDFQIPLWLFVVGASGDRKSSTVECFLDFMEDLFFIKEVSTPIKETKTYLMNYITPNTLASGFVKNVENDLAPKLKNKLVITGDFAQFLKMNTETKAAIWSQFREAYEGRIQKATGSGVETRYTDIFFDWLACSTPAIDGDLLLKDELGTRELIYRMPTEENEEKDKTKLMEAVWNNVDSKEQRKRELSNAVKQFFVWFDYNKECLEHVEISEAVKKRLFEYADFVTQLRVSAECDWRSGDLTNFVYPEKPTRILEQLKMLFVCLKQIDYGYSDDDALKRIFEVVKSSIHPVRLKILLAVKRNSLMSTTKISNKVGLAYSTTNRELQISLHLGVMKREKDDNAFIWSLNENHPLVPLLGEFDKGLKEPEPELQVNHKQNQTLLH